MIINHVSTDNKSLRINISDEVKTYSRMNYTTDLTAFSFIFSKMTLRSSSLTYANLNDTMESQRVGVSQFAGSRFITCFSHSDCEIVPFWLNYGGENKNRKVLLRFENFCEKFEEAICTDYCLLEEGKKFFFYSGEYRRTLDTNCQLSQSLGLSKINVDFEIKSCISSIEMFNIEYIPIGDPVFEKDYSGEKIIDFGQYSEFAEKTTKMEFKSFDLTELGKQKSTSWKYEEETRIMSILRDPERNEWSFIDLRLKEEIFRNLIVVMSPWIDINSDEGKAIENEIHNIINSSSLSKEIKESISVVHSSLEGTINC